MTRSATSTASRARGEAVVGSAVALAVGSSIVPSHGQAAAGVDAQTARSIRQLMAESSESAVEIRGQAIEWVRKAEGRR